jgi:hypothetical protein
MSVIIDKCKKVDKNNVEYCSVLKKELAANLRFDEISPGNILSVPDNEFINYCPYCGEFIRI